jgi:hypothetical protein
MKSTASQRLEPPPSFRAGRSLPTKEVASWYTPGLVDGFGDRLLMFDNTDNEPLEVLRFNPGIAAMAGFEQALVERVQQLAGMTHSAFPAVRAVERLETDGSLALVSNHIPGKRLSAFFADSRLREGLSPAFVTAVLAQVVHAMSVLQSQGDDVAHCALTVDRVIVTAGARIRITEHVLGSALRTLNCSPAQLWREFGLVAPGSAKLDARADVFQVGILALSLLLGRRLTPTDTDAHLPAMLDRWSAASTVRSGHDAEMLRRWLERALQIGDSPYRSAEEAYHGLTELPSQFLPTIEPNQGPDEYLEGRQRESQAKVVGAVHAAVHLSGQEGHMPTASLSDKIDPPVPTEMPDRGAMPKGVVMDDTGAFPQELDAVPAERTEADLASKRLPLRIASAFEAAEPSGGTGSRANSSRRGFPSWLAGGVTAIALMEGVLIVTLLMKPSAPPAPSTSAAIRSAEARDTPGRAVPVAAPLFGSNLNANALGAVDNANVRGSSERALESPRPNDDGATIAIARAASNQRSGGVRLVAPIELKVLQGDRVIGSSADGPIVMTAGTYQLNLTNSALGFRALQAVTFRAGQITTLTVPVPRGRLNVNAQPWAQVWVDDRMIGETPLANVDIPIGEHEVIFRHPELGERRQSVTVRADGPARVTATFDR